METEHVLFKVALKRKNSDNVNDSRLLKKADLEESEEQNDTDYVSMDSSNVIIALILSKTTL